MAKAKPKPTPKPTPPPADKADPNIQAGDQPPVADKQPDPPPPADDSKSKPQGHVCVEPVRHNGNDYQPGDPIELTEAEAAPLLDQQAIAAA